MTSYDYVEMIVPAKAEYVGVVRLAVSGIASRLGFTYDAIEDLKIAISEAVTNAVQHAYDDESGEVLVGCASYEDRVELMITDHGQSFNFEEAKRRTGPYDEEIEPELLREGGLGLYLMETLMDEVKIHHEEGVTVFMTKYFGGERGEAHDEQRVYT